MAPSGLTLTGVVQLGHVEPRGHQNVAKDPGPAASKMRADRIDHSGLLPDEEVAGAVEHQAVLLFGRLGLHEPHAWPADRFADRLGVGSIVFLPLDVELHIGRRYQSHGVADCLELTRPMIGPDPADAYRRSGPGCSSDRDASAVEAREGEAVESFAQGSVLISQQTNGNLLAQCHRGGGVGPPVDARPVSAKPEVYRELV